jgi:hypothetical protein
MKKKELDKLQGVVVSCIDSGNNLSSTLYEGDIIIRKARASNNCTFGIFLKAIVQTKNPTSYYSQDLLSVYWISNINNQSDIQKTFELWNANKIKANCFKQEVFTYYLPNYYIQAKALKDFLKS